MTSATPTPRGRTGVLSRIEKRIKNTNNDARESPAPTERKEKTIAKNSQRSEKKVRPATNTTSLKVVPARKDGYFSKKTFNFEKMECVFSKREKKPAALELNPFCSGKRNRTEPQKTTKSPERKKNRSKMCSWASKYWTK